MATNYAELSGQLMAQMDCVDATLGALKAHYSAELLTLPSGARRLLMDLEKYTKNATRVFNNPPTI